MLVGPAVVASPAPLVVSATAASVRSVQSDDDDAREEWCGCGVCCCGLCMFWERLWQEAERHSDFMAEKFYFGPALNHWRERANSVRWCGFCWTLLVVAFTVLMLLFYIHLLTTQGYGAYNKDLMNQIDYMVVQNKTFASICLFKEGVIFPDWMDVMHHEGIWLQVVNTATKRPESFLQLEYGHDGTLWQLSPDVHPNPEYGGIGDRPWDEACHFMCGAVPQEVRDPMRLIWFFSHYRAREYNVFHWNCLDFARTMWHFYRPQNTTCRSRQEMHDIMVQRSFAATA